MGVKEGLREVFMNPSVKRLLSWSATAIVAASAGLIGAWEGKRNEAYLDPIGIPSICYGYTKNVKLGDKKTDRECLDLLTLEITEHYAGVKQCVKADLPLHATASLVSLAYNVGVPKFCSSTLVSLVNQGAPPEMYCTELRKWVYAGGKRYQGLVNRRADEEALCLGKGRWFKLPTTLLEFKVD